MTARTYHHGDLRNALLKAARALLEEQGPSALGLREIARRVGVSAPSAYHHFANLDAIAVSLAAQGSGELIELLTKAMARAGKGALRRSGEAYVAFARANPALYRLMFGEGFPAASQGGKAVRDLRQQTYALLKSGLEKRFSRDAIPSAALFLWALAHGLALLMIDGQVESSEDPDALVRRVLRLAGSGFSAT
jgi:AcrR family transcriptional regulator